MDRSNIWNVFRDVAPNLCYISRTRRRLNDLLDRSKDEETLFSMLDEDISREENPSFRTDLKILKGAVERHMKP